MRPRSQRGRSRERSPGSIERLGVDVVIDYTKVNALLEIMRLTSGPGVDIEPMITHHFILEHIQQAYDLFGNPSDGVLNVAITI